MAACALGRWSATASSATARPPSSRWLRAPSVSGLRTASRVHVGHAQGSASKLRLLAGCTLLAIVAAVCILQHTLHARPLLCMQDMQPRTGPLCLWPHGMIKRVLRCRLQLYCCISDLLPYCVRTPCLLSAASPGLSGAGGTCTVRQVGAGSAAQTSRVCRVGGKHQG